MSHAAEENRGMALGRVGGVEERRRVMGIEKKERSSDHPADTSL